MSVNSSLEEPLLQRILANGLDGITTCCLAEAAGKDKYIACCRPICGIPLSDKLREMSILKGFPFVYNTSKNHYYVCLYHRRVIVHEPALQKGELLERRDLSIYEKDFNFTDDEQSEISNDPLLKEGVKFGGTDYSENDENTEIDDRQSCARTECGSQSSSSDLPFIKCDMREKMKKPSKEIRNLRGKEDFEDQRAETAMPYELPMRLLSANTLRRYKKAFQLPHRSGTNTKSQLLEGISEHLASLDVPTHETIAHFLYQCKLHRNKLDFPSSNDVSDSILGHCAS